MCNAKQGMALAAWIHAGPRERRKYDSRNAALTHLKCSTLQDTAGRANALVHASPERQRRVCSRRPNSYEMPHPAKTGGTQIKCIVHAGPERRRRSRSRSPRRSRRRSYSRSPRAGSRRRSDSPAGRSRSRSPRNQRSQSPADVRERSASRSASPGPARAHSPRPGSMLPDG